MMQQEAIAVCLQHEDDLVPRATGGYIKWHGLRNISHHSYPKAVENVERQGGYLVVLDESVCVAIWRKCSEAHNKESAEDVTARGMCPPTSLEYVLYASCLTYPSD